MKRKPSAIKEGNVLMRWQQTQYLPHHGDALRLSAVIHNTDSLKAKGLYDVVATEAFLSDVHLERCLDVCV